MENSVISNAYATFRDSHDGQEPNVAYVDVMDVYGNLSNDVAIVIDVNNYDLEAAETGEGRVVPFIDDSEVFWYCFEGIRELSALVNEKGADEYGADFVIVNLIGFKKL